MEIERKYLIHKLPENLETYPCHLIEQAYLCTEPVVRIRRQDDTYILTYKGAGLMSREEYNLPLTATAYEHLLSKADGTVITKKRSVILLNGEDVSPLASARSIPTHLDAHPAPEANPALEINPLKIELDIFSGEWQGLQIAEVEFPDEETARRFQPPAWFGEEVTFDGHYHNSWLSQHHRNELEKTPR